MGSAGVWGGLGVENFMHTISSQVISPEGLSIIGRTIISMAEAEGLEAHANAVRIRLENKTQ